MPWLANKSMWCVAMRFVVDIDPGDGDVLGVVDPVQGACSHAPQPVLVLAALFEFFQLLATAASWGAPP